MTASFVRWPSGNVFDFWSFHPGLALREPVRTLQITGNALSLRLSTGEQDTMYCPGLEHGKHQRPGRRIRAAVLGFSHDGWRPASLSLEKSWLNPLNKSQECHHPGESRSTAFNRSLLHLFLFCFCRPWLASLAVLCTDIIMEHASVV